MNEATIPIEDGAIPEGWEPERFGIPKSGETIAKNDSQGDAVALTLPVNNWTIPAMIIRKKYHPGIDCIPMGWWVWNGLGSWLASSELGEYNRSVAGLQLFPDFVPPEDGKPRQIK